MIYSNFLVSLKCSIILIFWLKLKCVVCFVHFLCCLEVSSFNLPPRGVTSMLLFFIVLNLLSQLVYQSVFLLDEFSSLVNLPHQVHYNLNVVLIFMLYLFTWFYWFFKGMYVFILVSLSILYYVVFLLSLPHILLGFN